MPRPTKFRRVEYFPKDTYFVPLGKPKCELEEIVLKIEELEAMRLKDIEGLNQEECAEKMQVSRQTFQNIIDEARKKVAVALSEGKAININGGNCVLSGLRPAVIAMIASAGLSLAIQAFWGEKSISTNIGDMDIISIIIFLLALFVLRKWKLDQIKVMLAAGIIGLCLYLFF